MLTMGELVICGAILMLAFMAMLVVFIKNAVEQKTNVPKLILSMLKTINRRTITRKISKAPDEKGAEKNQEKGETMSEEIITEMETEPKDKKNATGLLASLTSAMFLWPPMNLFGKKNDKQKEMSKHIDFELEKLLAESALDEAETNRLENNFRSPSDEMNMINIEREARLKEIFKKGEDKGWPDAAEGMAGKAPGASHEGLTREIKVEKLQIQEGKAPNWDEIVPKKDPSQRLKDAEAMAPIAGMLGADIPTKGKVMDKTSATAIDSSGQLKINDMPVWGHTELGKPLDKFKPDMVKEEVSAPNERSSVDLPINNERSEMKNVVESKPSIMPVAAKPAPAAVTVNATVSAKDESAGGVDFTDDLLAELQEEMKDEDDISMEIMGNLKGTHIDVQDLTLDSMEVLARFGSNVKSNKKAKKKLRPKV